MKEIISFAEFIKNEILNFNWDLAQLDILFLSLLKTNGIVSEDKFVFGTSLNEQVEKINGLFKTLYNVEPEIKKLESKTKFIIDDENFINKFNSNWNKLKLKSHEDLSAFIAGAFLGKGWVSKPSSKFYHMEFRIGSIDQSKKLSKAIEELEIPCKTIEKGNWYITYVKKSTALSDLLSTMNANEARMYFEDERISRNFNASIAKMNSIEPYNLKKIIAISNVQIAAIKKLKNSQTWKTLNRDIVTVGEIRLLNPEYSLGDIQYVFSKETGKTISKSTVNNWLKIIVDLAE